MMNRVVLVGRLTKDPDLRYTPNGVPVANFTLAVNRTFTNQQGEREADFIFCVAWRRQAENIANYLKKGSLAGVDGRLQTRSYDDQDGKRVYITEVVADNVQFLEPRSAASQDRGGDFGGSSFDGSGQRSQGSSYGDQRNQGYTRTDEDPFSNDGQPIDISDDDLPF
ncbi:single-stranded DNA-binding protein [Siminovitchia fortis]|uniref:Single-stranded DNA-binding protein n=1 Tax=Siminovitchia fortis TaxID=254758 RepID=A0A443IQM1_9BACI|nr:single-stranded DNA-binding protein [Siminovitchia fortis]RWR08957.1 single-stranded DNA-binding protein [Siminovitchia fortis]WHY81390.1 single-stranded DNA-binding protein [Siminovitchia fortis]